MSHKIYTGLHVLNVTLGSKNTPEAQLGDVLAQPVSEPGQALPAGEVEIQNASWMQHVGFCSLPASAIAGQSAAESMHFRDTNTDVVFASRDIRSNSIYGSLGAGETAIFGSGADGQSQGIITIKNDGSINLNTTNGNSAGANAVSIKIGADNKITMKVDTGGTVYLGDDTVAAKELAYADKIDALITALRIFSSGLTTVNLAGNASTLNTALTGPAGAIAAMTTGTTKTKGS